MLLTLTTMTYAGEGRYTIVVNQEDVDVVWILDSVDGKLKYCWRSDEGEKLVFCKKWKDIYDD